MSAIEKRLVAAAKSAIDVIVQISQVGLAANDLAGGPAKATSALRVIHAVTTAVQAGFDRKIDPAQVTADVDAALETFEADIAANDAAIDAAADAKFDRSDAADDPAIENDADIAEPTVSNATPDVATPIPDPESPKSP